jgi:hypothetical protein
LTNPFGKLKLAIVKKVVKKILKHESFLEFPRRGRI